MNSSDAKMLIELLAQMIREDSELRNFAIKEFARAMGEPTKKMIPLCDAARILNKSQSWVYKNKGLFKYRKMGDSKSSVLMFDRCEIIDYMNNCG